MKLINGMEPERYLASLLLANSSYKGEKYYEKEDEYTEIIKENKHLLLDSNDNSLIDKGDDGDKKYNIYEYKNLTPKQLREMYRTVTGLNNDEEFTNQEIVKYLLDALQESKKVDDNEDGLMEQIEKMAKKRSEIKDIMKLLDKCVSLNPMCKSEVASVLYGNNYRKIPEDSVVLSMEEYRKLKCSYKGEKYYNEEDAFIWKVSYGEYELAEDGGIILDSTAASVFYVGDLVKIVFENEEDQIGIYRVVKVTDTQCICEFVK